MVVLNHLRALLFVPYSDLKVSSGVVIKGFYLVTSLGHQMVMVFFVLSGFFISQSVFRSVLRGWSWKNYMINRLTRLWVVLVPALILGALWDLYGIHTFAGTGVYAGLPLDTYILPFNSTERIGLLTLFGNLTFLQGVLVPTFGSNGPLWSLSYEFWYYMLFPLVVLTMQPVSFFRRLFYGLAALIIAWFVGYEIFTNFGVWLLGVGVAFLPPISLVRQNQRTVLRWLTLGVFLATVIGAKTIAINPLLSDYLVGISTAGLLYVLFYTTEAMEPLPFYESLSKKLASSSFTLYVVHFPPLVLLHAWLFSFRAEKWQPDTFHLVLGLMIVTITVGYSWGIARWTEAKTEEIRRKVSGQLG